MSPKTATAMIAIVLIVFFVGFFLGATGVALHYEEQRSAQTAGSIRDASYRTCRFKTCAHIERCHRVYFKTKHHS